LTSQQLEQKMNVLLQREPLLRPPQRWFLTVLLLIGALCAPYFTHAEFNHGEGGPVGIQSQPTGQGESSMSQEQIISASRTEHSKHPLLMKVKSQGRMRVIVLLRLDTWKPEATLDDPTAATMQREAIARLQDSLLRRMGSFRITSMRRFQFVPQVAMEVDAAGMSDLLANPEVVNISEDAAAAPTAPEHKGTQQK
jgi:hypothetical protein